MPLDHADPDGDASRSSPARSSRRASATRTCRGWCSCRAARARGPPGRLNRSGWLGRALADHRVLLLDSRGTGRSTPATRQTLARRGDAAGAGSLPHALPGRLDRARRRAAAPRARGRRRPWSLLGQSYGGFVAMTYLSLAPASPGEGHGRGRAAAAGPRAGRRLPRDLRAGAAAVRAAGRPLPRRRGPARRARRPPRGARRPAALRRPAHRAAAAVARPRPGLLRTAWRSCTTCSSRAWAGAGELADDFLAGVETRHDVRRPAALRAAARVHLLPGRRRRSWSAARVADSLPEFARTRGRCCRPARWCCPLVSRPTARSRRSPRSRSCSRRHDGWPTLYDLDGSRERPSRSPR